MYTNQIFKTLTVLTLIITTGCATAQLDTTKPIEFGGISHFKQNGESLNRHDLRSKLKTIPAAKDVATESEQNELMSLIFGIPGGFAFGWELGTAAGGGDANWAIGGVGAALWLTGIIFGVMSNNHLEDAVNLYNGTFLKPKNSSSMKLEPFFACHADAGVAGLTLKF